MQQPDVETSASFRYNETSPANERHDTQTTREHGWVDDDYEEHPSEHAERVTATDHVRRADDGHPIWEPHSSYSPYETEDPFTYGAERGYAQRPSRDRSPPQGRGSTRRDRF